MLTTLVEMKAYLGIDTSDTDNDTVLTDMINAVGSQFDKYTDRTLEATDYTLQIDGNGLEHIFLRNYPINTITSLHIDTDRTFGDLSEIDSDHYVKYDEDGEIALIDYAFGQGVFPLVRQCIKIVCNLGYTVEDTVVEEVTTATATLPADLKKAAQDQVKYLFRKYQNNEEGLSSYSTINNSVTLVENTALIKLVSNTLDKYVSRYHGCI